MGLNELIDYFSTATMPTFPVKINGYMTVGSEFVSLQIEMVKAGNKSALQRLNQFREYLEQVKDMGQAKDLQSE